MTIMTDAFVEAVTCATAARAADRCSNPNCRALTSGPLNDRRKSLTLGLAVHIAAASPSGRRYDPLLPDHEYGAYGNAIWLCQNCANLINNDVVLYPASLLRTWKGAAEEKVGESTH
ncbi:MAG: hypothetical protein DME08_06695 [Candidatus Rokuibacteriota bacterium]|nr:MAG: hypothetical protein DME08_06695 [Candidatus Rokubacteria bacterium]